MGTRTRVLIVVSLAQTVRTKKTGRRRSAENAGARRSGVAYGSGEGQLIIVSG